MTRQYKKQLPHPPLEHESTTWTYWISRDSLDGALSAKCSLWCVRPLRTRVGARVTWTSTYGHLGDFRPDEILAWRAFHTFPETNVELIRVETRPTKEQLDELKRKIQ